LIVFAMITMKKPDNEVVSLGDGTATTGERAASEKAVPAASEETEKPVESGAAILAANDTVPGSTLSESEEAAAALASAKPEEPVGAVVTKEEAPVVVAEKSVQDAGGLASAVAPKV